jgi:hypothetical protein
MDRLDLLVLRLTVARDESRLRPNTGVEVRVIAGQLIELALAGVLVDDEGHPAIVSDGPVAGGALDPLRERVAELAGWRWDQLFWRQGIYAKAVREHAVAELTAAEVWVCTAPARPFRPAARYADLDGDELHEIAGRLDAIITGQAEGSTRERILVALNALLFDQRKGQPWMFGNWIGGLDELSPTQRPTVEAIIEAANETAAIMRSGGSKDPVASAGF